MLVTCDTVRQLAEKVIVLTISVSQRLDDGTIDMEQYMKEVLLLGKEVATVMANVHEKGITHRDLSPENFMVEQASLKIQIIGFGSASMAVDGMTGIVTTLQ